MWCVMSEICKYYVHHVKLCPPTNLIDFICTTIIIFAVHILKTTALECHGVAVALRCPHKGDRNNRKTTIRRGSPHITFWIYSIWVHLHYLSLFNLYVNNGKMFTVTMSQWEAGLGSADCSMTQERMAGMCLLTSEPHRSLLVIF